MREEQAQLTRTRLARAAAALFVERGYPTTSVADVAREAGVSVQTVYNAFGTKPALLKAAYDLVLANDSEPIPMAERPAVVALYELSDPVAAVHAYARLAGEALERIGPLMLQVAAGAAAGNADLIAHQQITDAERLAGTGQLAKRIAELGALAPGVSADRARDTIWALISVQVWDLLTRVRGWSTADYQRWVGDTVAASIIAYRDDRSGPR